MKKLGSRFMELSFIIKSGQVKCWALANQSVLRKAWVGLFKELIKRDTSSKKACNLVGMCLTLCGIHRPALNFLRFHTSVGSEL